MAQEPVHYEVFTRRNAGAGWALELASEDRGHALEAARDALASSRAIGVKVSTELRRASGEYQSLTIFSRGELEPRKKGRGFEDGAAPLCATPADLYTVHARARIGRLFDGWLRRHAVTAFELLHRPDLVEGLEATGLEIQHAIQKLAVPEAQATGVSTHDAIRRFQKLAEMAIERLLGDARRGLFPDLQRDGLAGVLRQVAEAPDGAYRLGVAVARDLSLASGWTAKVERLLDLAEACGESGPGRTLLFHVLEQPLAEIVGGRAVLAEVLHGPADLGGNLALMARLVLPLEAETLAQRDPEVARALPPTGEEVSRLARWLHDPGFASVNATLVRRLLDELHGPRRLHPDDPCAELLTLRALARLLILSAGAVAAEDIEIAFVTRSRRLVGSDFVEAYLQQVGGGALAEAGALVRLAENMVGAANKQVMGDWLHALIGSHRFDREMRAGAESASARLAALAELQHALSRVGLDAAQHGALSLQLGEIAGLVEADSGLIQLVVRSAGAATGRLLALLRLANGEGAPVGPVSRRARHEALKLARDPKVRVELAAAPEGEVRRLRELLHAASLAA